MTTIAAPQNFAQTFNTAQNFGNALTASLQMLGNAAQLQVAAGILGQFVNNLNAGPFAQPSLPSAVAITTATTTTPGAAPTAGPSWTASMTGSHTAKVDLGDGYKLQIDERNSEMTIINENTGERTRVWGDPHVEVDGKHAFDFWGTTTFTLENGTKLTINTEQWNGNPNMYVASQVVITRGDRAIVVDGISQNQLGDLSVTQSMNGQALDAAHRDGLQLDENGAGGGWLNEAGKVATQKDGDLTAIGGIYGPGSTMPSWKELTNELGGFLLNRFAQSFGDAISTASDRAERRVERQVERQAERFIQRFLAQ